MIGFPLALTMGAALTRSSRKLDALVTTVPTYEALSIAVSNVQEPVFSGGCALSYRNLGAAAWIEALPLWWDARTREYRGSIVNLTPQTTYQIRITHDDGRTVIAHASTWPEVSTLPIKRVVELPAKLPGSFILPIGGDETGYVLYRPAAGLEQTLIEGGSVGLSVAAGQKYIILHRLKFSEQEKHCICIGPLGPNMEDISDIIVDSCEFSRWGEKKRLDGTCDFAANLSSAVYSYCNRLKRVTIQGCYAYNPSSGSNSWSTPNCSGRSRHPEGVQFVTLRNRSGVRGDAGNFVIRWNTVTFTRPSGAAYTDPLQDSVIAANDAIGDTNNFRTAAGIAAYGSPFANSDIYRNVITDVYDEPFEIDGRAENVRIWENYCDKTYIGVSFAPVGWGPVYFWNNVYQHSRKSNLEPQHLANFLKYRLRGSNAESADVAGGGKIYVFNNTLLPSFGRKHGWNAFASQYDASNAFLNVDFRNNIATLSSRGRYTFNDPVGRPSSSFADNLGNLPVRHGSSNTHPGWIQGVPVYSEPDAARRFDALRLMGDFRQRPSSPGHRSGSPVPNFLTPTVPDRGAHQSSDPIRGYGHLNMPEALLPPTGA